VVLEAESMAGIHVEDLADVPIGMRPVEFIAPGLLDALDLILHRPAPA
jgi:hypothetical protein